MPDPFDAVVPIGTRPEPENFAGMSRQERARRGKLTRANRGPDNQAILSSTPSSTPEGAPGPARNKRQQQQKKTGRRTIGTPELERMVDRLLELNYRKGKDPNARSQDAKNATIAFAVLVDKKQVIRGKPSQIVGFQEAEAQRPGLRELAKLISGGGGAA